MGGFESFQHETDTLERELPGIEAVFRGLSEGEWGDRTKLVPVQPEKPHWTVFELAGHFDISMGLTRMLIADLQDGQPGRPARPGSGQLLHLPQVRGGARRVRLRVHDGRRQDRGGHAGRLA